MTEPRTKRVCLSDTVAKIQAGILQHDDRELRRTLSSAELRGVYLECVCSDEGELDEATELFGIVDTLRPNSADEQTTSSEEITLAVRNPKAAVALPYTQLWLSILTTFLAVDTYVACAAQADLADDLKRLLDKVLSESAIFCHLASGLQRQFDEQEAFFAISRLFSLAGKGATLRPYFLEQYRTSALDQSRVCQATLINQLLHSYIDSHEHELAIQFILKTTFPEDIQSTTEIVRCLFNLGRIQAVRLEYSDAHEKLITAVRKLPPNPNVARGFKILAYKHAIVVELLMGDVPEISIFQQEPLRGKLDAYFGIVTAVRGGDLVQFGKVVEANKAEFHQDGTLFLIERLHHSVIKAGLRRINNAYCRISLRDIATKVGISCIEDTEGILAKAIVDGVVLGVIDSSSGCLVSADSPEKYKTMEPAEQFHKRIKFCQSSYHALCAAHRL